MLSSWNGQSGIRSTIQQGQAATTLRQLLDRAATENALVLSYHFAFPSLGYLSQKDKGWQWEPIE
jgi:hypothetical protein